jgi:hypothetical protein
MWFRVTIEYLVVDPAIMSTFKAQLDTELVRARSWDEVTRRSLDKIQKYRNETGTDAQLKKIEVAHPSQEARKNDNSDFYVPTA